MEGRREGSKQGKRILCVFVVFFSLFSLPTGARLVVAGGQHAEAVRLERSPSACRKTPLPRRSRRGRGTCGFAALAFRHMCPARGQEAPMIFLCFPLFFYAAPRAVGPD